MGYVMTADIAAPFVARKSLFYAAAEITRRAAKNVINKKSPPQSTFIWETRLDANGNRTLYFPAMFVSDIHLGTALARAKRFCHMMERTQTGELYAIGDIVDLENMRRKKRWNFAPHHMQVLAHLLRKNATIIAGNHDEDIRERNWLGKQIFGSKILDEARVKDAKGDVFKVEHSDYFDDHVFGKSKKFWYALGDFFFMPLAHFDIKVQDKTGWDWFSTAACVKYGAKLFINQGLGVDKAIAQSVDADPTIQGYINGHSHDGHIKSTPKGKTLINDGHSTINVVQAAAFDCNGTKIRICDWRKTHLVYEEAGHKYKLYYKDLGLDCAHEPKKYEDKYTEQAQRIVRVIYRLAQPKNERHPKGTPRPTEQLPPQPPSYSVQQAERRAALHPRTPQACSL